MSLDQDATTVRHEDAEPYVQVWGDVVDPRHLWSSVLIGAATGLGSLLAAGWAFRNIAATAELRDGYALLVGLVGCLVAAAVCARLFPPKRVVHEQALSREEHQTAVEEIAGTSGPGAIASLSPHAARELRSVGLHAAFTRVDPENSENRP